MCLSFIMIFTFGAVSVFANPAAGEVDSENFYLELFESFGDHFPEVDNFDEAEVIVGDGYAMIGITVFVNNDIDSYAVSGSRLQNPPDIILGEEELMSMSFDEIVEFIHNNTSFSTEEVIYMANSIISQREAAIRGVDIQSGFEPFSGPLTSMGWRVNPRITNTRRWAVFATSWIGIDAFRSSVGMSFTQSVNRSISYTVGFTGSAQIRNFNSSLTASRQSTHSITITHGTEVPAWTTSNWRPYITEYRDTWEGTEMMGIVISIFPIWQVVFSHDEVRTGTNHRLINETTEIWSRVNTNQLTHLPTPLPPTGPPPGFQ